MVFLFSLTFPFKMMAAQRKWNNFQALMRQIADGRTEFVAEKTKLEGMSRYTM